MLLFIASAMIVDTALAVTTTVSGFVVTAHEKFGGHLLEK